MSIRLNKAIRELNIGLGTAVEFLEKRPDLGEVKSDPSCKISDEQYNALSAAFAKDKEVRTQAEKLFQKKPKEHKESKKAEEKKAVEAAPKAEEKKEARQEFKPLGKIDLDSLNGKKKPEPKVEEKAEKKAEPVKVEKPEPVKAEPEKKEVAKAEAPKAEPKKPEPVKVKVDDYVEQEVEVFTTKNERKMLGQKMNVVGKIDLDSLNQSTRPKKKTKEERRKEREEKAQQARDAQKAANGERKKRNRMNKERVDINAAANQPQGNGKKNGNNQNGQGGKKNKNKNKNNKPQEVNEEDVARQVKETLARLTSKSSQNKKGAKYRKEKRDAAAEKRDEELLEQELGEKTLKLTEFVTVSELATMMDIPVTKLIGTLMSIGVMVSINQRLDAETINIVAEEFGFTTEYVKYQPAS